MTALVYNLVVTARVRECVLLPVCVCVCALVRVHVCPVMTAAVYNGSSLQRSFGPPSLPRLLSGVTRVRVDDDVIFSPLCDL